VHIQVNVYLTRVYFVGLLDDYLLNINIFCLIEFPIYLSIYMREFFLALFHKLALIDTSSALVI